MGQPIVVNEKRSTSNPGMVRFELNRILTGMGHERYQAGTEVFGERPPDVLARRLFEHGGVDGVHVNGNVVTVDLTKGSSSDGLREVIEGLYTFYVDSPAPAAEAEEPPAAETAEEPEAAPEAVAEPIEVADQAHTPAAAVEAEPVEDAGAAEAAGAATGDPAPAEDPSEAATTTEGDAAS